MEMPVTSVPDHPAPVAAELPRPVSHTSDNPQHAPHTLTNKSTIASPEPFIRIFLLAWAVRYIPRGLLGEIFSKSTLDAIKTPISKFVDHVGTNQLENKINHILSENASTVLAAKRDVHVLHDAGEGTGLYKKLRPLIRNWRGDASKEIHHIVSTADTAGVAPKLSVQSKGQLRDMIRGAMDDIGYSLSLFVGSSLLSLHYSRLVRSDILNLFREAVAYEKDIPQEKVTFNDIVASDNHIVKATVKNYHQKLWERLGSDSLFLLTTPLKSMSVTDFLLGVKGVQMFRDTWRRNPTIFEDLVTFVNNKINPTNGLGQPVSIGEVFDLYQHYAQAHQPDHAFVGVIEHAKSEGARWSENQIIFSRLTDLLNKTYAYKHESIVDNGTGLTVLQADFALPKFIYLLGHDLIDVTKPEQTLTTIEVANSYGIPAVKEMVGMLKAGKSLEQITQRFPVTLPEKTSVVPAQDNVNAVLPKNPTLDQLPDAAGTAPATQIDTQSIAHVAPQAATHSIQA